MLVLEVAILVLGAVMLVALLTIGIRLAHEAPPAPETMAKLNQILASLSKLRDGLDVGQPVPGDMATPREFVTREIRDRIILASVKLSDIEFFLRGIHVVNQEDARRAVADMADAISACFDICDMMGCPAGAVTRDGRGYQLYPAFFKMVRESQ